MRVAVPCFGQLRLFSLAAGASLGFLLACGGPGDGGLFSTSSGGNASLQGGSPSSGGAVAQGGFVNTGGSAQSSGGSASSSGGQSASGGAALGGSGTGGSATTTGGTASKATGGASPTGTGGAAPGTGGALATGGALTTGGAAIGGALATGGAPASGGQGGGGKAGAPATGGASTGGVSSTGGASGTGGGTGGCPAKAVEICDGLDNNCNNTVDEGAACPAKCTGFILGSHGYMVCDVEQNARKASALCEENGMRLAWIESADENAGLLKAISALSSGQGGGVAEVSIGATDVEDEGRWHWLDGADFWKGGGKGSAVNGAYTNWAEDRPNNDDSEQDTGEDCAVLVIDEPDDGEPGQWNDVECVESHGVLCEVP